MISDIYWIETNTKGRLAITARPRAGDWLPGEIEQWAAAGISLIVSLLEDSENDELGLKEEGALCTACGMDFVSFPIRDRGLPTSTRDAVALAALLASLIEDGKAVAVHCRAGIGRSGLIAAATLIQMGQAPEDAFSAISTARRLKVPDTQEQYDWACSLAPSR